MNRVTFYFDGFNFYNGLKEQSKADKSWRKYYWFDVVKFCQSFISPDQTLVAVKYFTSDPLNVQQRQRHKKFFEVNSVLNPNTFQIINGKYKKKNIECNLCHSVFEHPEEKRTDVNLSVSLLLDCALDKTDTLILVSADTDLIPAIQAIKVNYPTKKIRVYFPPSRTSGELYEEMKRNIVYLAKNKYKFEGAKLPNNVEISGVTYSIPDEWKMS